MADPKARMRGALAVAVLGAATFALSAQAAEHAGNAGDKEKCFGIAKARQNNCAAANGSHSCAGQARMSYEGQDFLEVPKGSCEKMRGALKAFNGVNEKMLVAPGFNDG
jgi:uncharacterized membrane protein